MNKNKIIQIKKHNLNFIIVKGSGHISTVGFEAGEWLNCSRTSTKNGRGVFSISSETVWISF